MAYVRFDGMLDEKTMNIKYYYPTSDLVTIQHYFLLGSQNDYGLEFKGEVPFKMYILQELRDKQRRKMSKSLGKFSDQ